ncbi:MAG: YitT family protein [Vallitaleaceae bacterium]|nr:YitT family protein [Vallitaleaceae bacterium]
MERIKDFLIINFGLILVALGIYFFKVPNHFAIGGVSGIAIIITNYFPSLSIGPLLYIINGILILLGFIFLGFKFTSKSIYSSIALSSMVWALETLLPIQGSLTSEPMLDLLFAVFLPGIGSAIVFSRRTSTGGTDILAKILNKYMRINIGKTLLISDLSITIIAGMTFGIRIGLFSILGLFIKGFMIDMVIESIYLNKQVVIVSDEVEHIKEFIIKTINRSATIHKAYGAYTGEEKEVITAILTRKQAAILKDFVKNIDPLAFVSIMNTSEIVGRGFRNVDL